MREWRWTTLRCAALLTAGTLSAANASPAPGKQDDVRDARFALGFNAAKRCPEVRAADAADPAVALVLFKVGPSGVPSEPSIKSSSGSAELDAAALKCVPQLRFQPATSFGDGTALASWQQMAWRWANPQAHSAAAGPPTVPVSAATAPASAAAPLGTAAGAASTGAIAAGAVAAAGLGGVATHAQPPGATAAGAALPAAQEAEVRVCVDAAGKLAQEPTVTHSSGDTAFDQAAVKIARSGSGYYRPPMVNGTPAAGCMLLAIRPQKGAP